MTGNFEILELAQRNRARVQELRGQGREVFTHTRKLNTKETRQALRGCGIDGAKVFKNYQFKNTEICFNDRAEYLIAKSKLESAGLIVDYYSGALVPSIITAITITENLEGEI